MRVKKSYVTTREKERKIKYPDNDLTRKMKAMGWDLVEDFYWKSSVHKITSKDTVRRLILHEEKIIEPLFIKILESLGFTPNEIRRQLKKWDYKDFIHLIGEQKGVAVDSKEAALTAVYKSLTLKNPDIANTIASFFESLCVSLKVDCSGHIHKLKSK